MINVLAYDVGTTGVKTCLFRIAETIERVDTESASYGINVLPGGGIEQNPDDWWAALCETTQQLAQRNPDFVENLAGISFCAQMQSMVMVDENGKHVHPSMNYMDQRAGAEMKSQVGQWPRIAGVNAVTVLRSLRRTGAVAASVKDPVWKYHWLRNHAPEEFARGHKWLDVKEAIIARMTGKCVMSRDTAFATLLYDINSDEPRFDPVTMKMLGVDPRHMPDIVESTDIVGTLRAEQAQQLGLPEGVPVYAGGGDANLIGVGAGATAVGSTHVYVGTSGWVSTVTEHQTVDIQSMIAALVGCDPGHYNYFAELETAGKCLEWVKDHLALDEINIFLDQRNITEHENSVHASLYDYLSEVISRAEPGAGGVLFTPWLHGNRCPFEDPLARASFMNISLETGKTEMLRAVVEGVALHIRWFIETQDKNRKVHTSERVRFVGGGALSSVTAQILADVLQRGVDVVETPQDVGAVGAALLVAVGEGVVGSIGDVDQLVSVEKSFEPNPQNKAVYDRQYEAFTSVYKSNKKIFSILNGGN